jgi:Ca-activated chloride channel family protein
VTFQWPLALLGLLIVPLAIGAYVLHQRRRGREVARFSTPALFPNAVAKAPGRLRHVPVAVGLLALTAVLVGVARPHATVSEPREEATVMLAIDVSRSMTADDVPPTRLAAAQDAVRRFIAEVPETFRIGMVAFADRARVVAPPTDDRGVIEAALEQTRSGEGTALGEAIVLSLRAAQRVPGAAPGDPPPPASVLLISDGAQTQGEVTPQQAAQRARRVGIPVYTIAVGTENGVVERQLPGGYTERIRVPPDPRALRQVAASSGGEFFTAVDEERLRRVYEELGSRLGSREKRAEITVAFAGAGMGLLLVAGGLSTLLFRRLP